MKKYTFEELVEPFSNNEDSEWFETMQTEDVLRLLKQVRQSTLQEAANKAVWYYNGEPEYLFHYADDIHVNKQEILDLDKDSIEVNE